MRIVLALADQPHLQLPVSFAIMTGNQRNAIRVGAQVRVVQKHHQRTGELTEGVVQRILTKSSSHPHGIKVMLEGGIVGRVKEIIGE